MVSSHLRLFNRSVNAILLAFLEVPLAHSVVLLEWPHMIIDLICPSVVLLLPSQLHTLALWYLQICKVLISTLGRSYLGMKSTVSFVTCSFFLPSGQILDPFPVSYYNSQLYRHSYFQVEFHFTIFCHISSASFSWCIVSSIVTVLNSCQLNTFIKLAGDMVYSLPFTRPWIKILKKLGSTPIL